MYDLVYRSRHDCGCRPNVTKRAQGWPTIRCRLRRGIDWAVAGASCWGHYHCRQIACQHTKHSLLLCALAVFGSDNQSQSSITLVLDARAVFVAASRGGRRPNPRCQGYPMPHPGCVGTAAHLTRVPVCLVHRQTAVTNACRHANSRSASRHRSPRIGGWTIATPVHLLHLTFPWPAQATYSFLTRVPTRTRRHRHPTPQVASARAGRYQPEHKLPGTSLPGT